MFTLAFDRRHKILLTRVSGVVSSGDVTAMDDAVQHFTARHGPAHGVVDFSAVSTVAVPIGRLVHRAPNRAGYKQVVVARSEWADLARRATREPLVVASVDEAMRTLGASDASFEPVEPNAR
jgi:hypothetical protein